MFDIETSKQGEIPPLPAGTSARHKKYARRKKKRHSFRFVFVMLLVSFSLSVGFSYTANIVFSDSTLGVSVILLFTFVAFGAFFDIVAVSATSAELKTFNSMAARKVRGAKQGIWLIKNAEKVASICGDVCGDISGIMSGVTGAAITATLLTAYAAHPVLTPLLVTGVIASMTIGSKAVSKGFAVREADKVIFVVGKVLSFFRH